MKTFLLSFVKNFEYTPVSFHAYQSVNGERKLIYHTNVMMAITERSVVICLDALDDKKERKSVIQSFKRGW